MRQKTTLIKMMTQTNQRLYYLEGFLIEEK